MKTALSITLTAVVLLLIGCGTDGTNPENRGADPIEQGSSQQVRSVVQQFQQAAAAHDDAAGCELLTEGVISGILLQGVPADHPQAQCNVDAALFYRDSITTFPTAHIAYIRIDPHDSAADVQFDNGTRLKLVRSDRGEPWRIDDIGWRPDRSQWTR